MVARRVVLSSAVVCCVAVLGFAPAAYAADAPTPAPYPSGGGDASAWTCQDTSGPGGATGSSCAVSSWEPRPDLIVPAPVVSVAPAAAAAGLTEDQFAVLGFGVIVLVLLAGASLVGSWRS